MTHVSTETITSVAIESPGTIALYQEEARELQDREFYVRTLYTGISAGTELTFFLGTNPKSSEGWDEKHRLFRGDMEPSLGDIYPKVEGYMEVGKVALSKNPDVPVGTNVAMRYGHKDGHVAAANEFYIALPENMDPMLGIWAAQMGPICMNGILYAADEVQRKTLTTLEGSLADQRVIVFGAGMIGLLSGVFAKWAGAREVVVVDGIEERLKIAEKLGLVAMPAKSDLAIDVKDRWQADDPLDSGADIALQCTGSDYLLSQAFSSLREQGTVVDLGFYQQGTNQVFLGKEFHHNRLRHICAQIGAIPRQQQNVWSRPKLSEETVKFLQTHGQTLKETLVTHVLPFAKAQEAYERLAQRDPDMLQVVLQPATGE